jgi:hypothetical protein
MPIHSSIGGQIGIVELVVMPLCATIFGSVCTYTVNWLLWRLTTVTVQECQARIVVYRCYLLRFIVMFVVIALGCLYFRNELNESDVVDAWPLLLPLGFWSMPLT